MWVAIAVTVLAATGNSIGKVLQKQAAGKLPRLVLKQEVVAQFLASKLYMLGMACDLCGALLMVFAFAHAPVSVVQPVSAIGLVSLLIFSHFYLAERLRPAEWTAAALAGVGVLGLGATAESHHMAHPDNLHPARIMGGFLAMVAAVALECWVRHRRAHHPSSLSKSMLNAHSADNGASGHSSVGMGHHSGGSSTTGASSIGVSTTAGGALDGGSARNYRGAVGRLAHASQLHGGHLEVPTIVLHSAGQGHANHTGHPPQSTIRMTSSSSSSSNIGGGATAGKGQGAGSAADAVMCGLEGGACFGLSAACCRTGFILARRVGWPWAIAGLIGSVSLTSSGFILQTKGLKSGSTIVVCTMAAVSSMVTGVFAGLLALEEALPSSPGLRLARWASWAAILLGVSSLAAGTAGLRAAATTLAGYFSALLPRWLWRLLPRGWAVHLHHSQKAALLPTSGTHHGSQQASI